MADAFPVSSTGGGGGGATPIRTPFVFRPGGVAVDNVYTSWAALYAKYLLVAGPKVIEFDDSFAACVIPVGFYDMAEAEWTCRFKDATEPTQVTVTLADGVTLDRLGLITNRLKVIASNTAGAVMAGASLEGMTLQGGAELQNVGTSPFVSIAPGTSFEIVLLDYASITFGGGGGGAVVEVSAPAGQLLAKLGVGAVWQASTISGGAPATVLASIGALSATFDETQPGFAGTITVDVLLGDLLVGDDSAPTGFVKLPIGTPGQVLTVVGGTAAWAASGGGGGALTINNTVFVSKNGNDATGLRNRWDKPFLTIQAAINAALAGDTIYIFPGTYAETLVMTQINKVHIKGAGINEVVIAPAAGVPFTWVITVAGITQFEMSDLTLQSAGGGGGATCLSIDGNAVADAASSFPGFVFRKLKIDDNEITNAIDFRRLADVRIYDCVVTQADSRFRNVGRLWAYNSEMARPVEHYDVAEPQPTGGRNQHYYIGCHMSAFRWEGHPIVNLDHDCIVRGSSTQGVLSVSGANVPELHSRARHETGVTFLTLPVTSIIDFDFSVFTVTSRIRFAQTGAGPARLNTTFKNAVLQQDGAGLNRIEGADFIDFDLRDATFSHAALFPTTAGATSAGYRRTLYALRLVLAAGLNPGIPIVPQWPPTGPAPTIIIQSLAAGTTFAVTLSTPAAFDVVAGAPDTADAQLSDASP